MRFSQSVGLSIAASVLFAGSCATEPEPEPEARDVSPHRVGDLYVNSLRIQYLDWGGTGDSTMFLPYQRSVIEQLQRDIPSVRIVRVAGIGHNALPVVARDRLIAEPVQFTEPRVAREE